MAVAGTDPPAGTKKTLVPGSWTWIECIALYYHHQSPGSEQPVYGLQAKGLNGVDKPLDTIETIATYYISEIRTIDKEGPYALAGFPLGGRIAYEMARQLDEMGKKVSFWACWMPQPKDLLPIYRFSKGTNTG